MVGGIIKTLTVKDHTCNWNVIGYYLLLHVLLLLCFWIKVLLLLLAGTPPDWRYFQINSIIIDLRV